ncbi:MAG: glutathione S-transferase family protein [Rhodobacteraceae bacterium]|nr:glutathione S-transferase family protein [Paracoccaceae bacterium]
MPIKLFSFRHSVYGRIARMTLLVRGLDYELIETDPFADPPDPVLAQVSPFGLVPVLEHDGFRLTETAVICRYLAQAFPGDALIPDDPRAAARMAQVAAVIDTQGYWPMVRQVFGQAVFLPMMGETGDPELIADGLADARTVLQMLDGIAAEGLVLNGPVTLADLHLAPMMAYFTGAPQGAAALAEFSDLSRWWQGMAGHPALGGTDPALATMPARG